MNLTIREAANVLALHPANVRRWIERNSVPTTTDDSGRRLISLSSLPAEAQRRYLEQLAHRMLRKEDGGTDHGVAQLAGDPAKLQLALERFEMIQQAETGDRKPETVSAATLYRWRKRWGQTQNLASLLRCERSDKGQYKTFDREAIAYMVAVYHKKGARKAYAALLEEAERKGGVWFVGSFKRACRIMSEHQNNAVRMVYTGNDRALEDRVLPPITRTPAEFPNDRWSGDHHQCDTFVRLHNRLVRPWLTAFLDEGTRAIIGWCLTTKPSSKSISRALRHGILRKPDDDTPFHGIPRQVHIDNGKDYISKYLSGNIWRMKHHRVTVDLETEGVFAELGIHPIYAKPFNAKSKIIERFFGTFEEQFGKDQRGYCGMDSKHKPAGFKDAWSRYETKGNGWEKEWPTWEEYFAAMARYIRRYNAELHRTIGMSPVKKWAASIEAGFEPRTIESGALDVLMMQKKESVVTNGGVKVPGLIGRHWHEALMPYIGDNVSVYYEPMNMQTVRVYDDGRFLCEAEYQSPVANNAHEEIKRRNERKGELRKKIKEQMRQINAPLHDEKFDSTAVIEEKQEQSSVIGREKQTDSDFELVPVWDEP